MDYNIQNKSTLNLQDGIQIFVKTPSNKTITFRVWMSNTIHDLKVQICAKGEIDVPHQRLVFVGIFFQDKLTVGNYNIHKESTLHLCERMHGSIQNFINTYYYFLFNTLDEHWRIDRSYYNVTQCLKSSLLGFFDSGCTDLHSHYKLATLV
jgi:hypothetical protein